MSRREVTISEGSRFSRASHSKMKKKTLDGRCHCGEYVILLKSLTITNPGRWFIRCPLFEDCNYFVWVDEIDGGWQSLARCLIRRLNEHECGITNQDVIIAPIDHSERNVNMPIKVEKKIEDEIKAMRV
ncbi:hypothetical protein Ahy_B06g084895 [Arachis hypogaea]|uniref:GRF-type domain-containing protein n=1 Tax=Arachis hypogaea TaxID=3818 RepID=A0A444YT01_ARAHY|nr:hypothetical protein Ahy_B06g084895 [Arachis hypogaea]